MKKRTYPQIHWQLIVNKHTELRTSTDYDLKNLFKTDIYGGYLDKFVDNLCKCVDKHDDKSVLTYL